MHQLVELEQRMPSYSVFFSPTPIPLLDSTPTVCQNFLNKLFGGVHRRPRSDLARFLHLPGREQLGIHTWQLISNLGLIKPVRLTRKEFVSGVHHQWRLTFCGVAAWSHKIQHIERGVAKCAPMKALF
jgi:hypothetical protein